MSLAIGSFTRTTANASRTARRRGVEPPLRLEALPRLLLVSDEAEGDATLDVYAQYLSRLLGGSVSRWAATVGQSMDIDSVTRAASGHAIVIVGPQRQSMFRRALRGTAANRLADRVPASVLAAREPRLPIRHVLAVTRSRDHDDAVADWAARIALASGAMLTLLVVVPEMPLACTDHMRQIGESAWRDSDTPVGRQIRHMDRFVPGWSWNGAIRFQVGAPIAQVRRQMRESEPDLVVVGADDRGWLSKRVTGRVAWALLRDPSPAVLVARPWPRRSRA